MSYPVFVRSVGDILTVEKKSAELSALLFGLHSQFLFKVVDVDATFLEFLVDHEILLKWDVGFNPLNDRFIESSFGTLECFLSRLRPTDDLSNQ